MVGKELKVAFASLPPLLKVMDQPVVVTFMTSSHKVFPPPMTLIYAYPVFIYTLWLLLMLLSYFYDQYYYNYNYFLLLLLPIIVSYFGHLPWQRKSGVKLF